MGRTPARAQSPAGCAASAALFRGAGEPGCKDPHDCPPQYCLNPCSHWTAKRQRSICSRWVLASIEVKRWVQAVTMLPPTVNRSLPSLEFWLQLDGWQLQEDSQGRLHLQ